jgi:hypothetical protein
MAAVKKVKKAQNGDSTSIANQKFTESLYDAAKSNSEKAKEAAKKRVFLGNDFSPSRSLSEVGKSSSKDLEDFRKAVGKKQKNGGITKAKDGKWIQKAVNPKHKGYCTPMTKATCTPKRKALAKTFKAMGKARKGK